MNREYIFKGIFYNPLLNNPPTHASCEGRPPLGGVHPTVCRKADVRPLRVISLLLTVCLSVTLSIAQESVDAADLTLHINDRIVVSYIDVGPQGTPIEKSNVLTIRPDGTIFHALIGTVKLTGLNLSDAEEILKQRFSQYFTEPRVAVNIVEKTSIKIILYGEVNRMGVFAIKPNTPVAEFIIENGGTTADADISRIAVSRIDGTRVVFDMERYLYTNEPVNNILLKDKDKIIVPKAKIADKYGRLSKNYMLQYGNVLKITINELALMETNPAQAETYVIDSEGNIFHRLFGLVHLGGVTVDKAQNILAEMARRYYREPVVAIDVVELSSRSVFVFGEVTRPGIYPIEGNIQLAEFLANIGGVTDAADLEEIVVTRKEGKPVVFNLEDFLFKRDNSKNVYLEDGDRIIVLKRQRGILVSLSEKLQPLQVVLQIASVGLSLYILLLTTGA